VDLPLNTGSDDLTKGLGFPNDLQSADLLAFELNTIPGLKDGGCYTIVGAEFFESNEDYIVEVVHAEVQSSMDNLSCGDATCDPNGPDLDQDGIAGTCDKCPNSDLTTTIVIDGCDTGIESKLNEDGCTANDFLLKGVRRCAKDNRDGRESDFEHCVRRDVLPSLVDAGYIASNQRADIAVCTDPLKICTFLSDFDCDDCGDSATVAIPATAVSVAPVSSCRASSVTKYNRDAGKRVVTAVCLPHTTLRAGVC